MNRMDRLPMRDVRMAPSACMIPGFVMVSCHSMMASCAIMVLGGLAMMLGGFFRHAKTSYAV
jgi:hypothetical protein